MWRISRRHLPTTRTLLNDVPFAVYWYIKMLRCEHITTVAEIFKFFRENVTYDRRLSIFVTLSFDYIQNVFQTAFALSIWKYSQCSKGWIILSLISLSLSLPLWSISLWCLRKGIVAICYILGPYQTSFYPFIWWLSPRALLLCLSQNCKHNKRLYFHKMFLKSSFNNTVASSGERTKN